MATRDDISVDYQPSPRVVEVKAPSIELTVQDLVDTLRVSEEAFTEGLAFDKLIDAAGKEPLGGGVLVGITATLQNTQVAFEARTTAALVGVVTTASGSAVNGLMTFQDTSADYISSNISRGSLVINFTDNSVADVYDVVDGTTLTTRTLVNGADNEYEVGDSYQIFNIIQCNVSGGNLVSEDDLEVAISSLVPTAFTQIVRTASSSATLQESRDIQYSSFNGCVTVDESSVYAGTSFPLGTPRQPVNNWADALNIATERGLSKFCVLGNAVLTGFVFDNYVFEGQSISKSSITINASASVLASEFNNCTVTGTLDGNSIIEKAAVANLDFVDGIIRNSGLLGTITLSGASNLQILNCYEGSSVVPIVDFNGSGSGLIVTNYSGSIQLDNKTGSENAYLDMASGEIIISSSVTAGEITLRGVAKWENKFSYAGGANIIDETIFTRVDESHGQVIRNVFLDGTALSNGNGYQSAPFDNWADTIQAASDRGLRNLVVSGDIVMDRDIANYTIRGLNLPTVVLTGFKIDKVNFIKCVVTGTQGTVADPTFIQFYETCGLLDLVNFDGSADGCALGGTIEIADNSTCVFNGATELVVGVPIILDFKNGTAGSTVGLEDATGNYIIRNMTHPDDVLNINFASGEITIENNCTAGSVQLHGIGDWENSNTFTGTTDVTNHFVSPKQTQYSTYNGSVWLDIGSSTVGTEFPAGTPQFPVSNDADAKTIAVNLGFSDIHVLSNVTLIANHTNHKFIGRSPRTTQLTIDPTATLSGCEFENLLLTGSITGGTYITRCALKNVTGLGGHIEQCVIREGTNTLLGSSIAMFNKCVAVSAPNPQYDGTVEVPIIDCAGSGQGIAFRGLIGELKFINKTGPEGMTIACDGARVELDSTITDGIIRVFGVGTLIDNSSGTAVVDKSELVAPEYIMEEVWSAAAAAFDAADSMGNVMNDLRSMAAGKIVENPSGTFTFYDRDNITVRFVLTKAGSQRNRS
jgi:hypothetical protein